MCNFYSDLQVLYLKKNIIIIILYFLTLIEKVVKIILKSARSIGIVWAIIFNASIGKSIANTFFMKYRHWYWLYFYKVLLTTLTVNINCRKADSFSYIFVVESDEITQIT